MNYKKLFELSGESIVLFLIMVAIHEWGHVQIINLLGGKAVVEYGILWGKTTVTSIPPITHWHIFVALAGGLTVSILFWVLDHFIQEDDASIALRVISSHQFTYSIMEGLELNHTPISLLITSLGIIIGFLFSMPLFRKILNNSKN